MLRSLALAVLTPVLATSLALLADMPPRVRVLVLKGTPRERGLAHGKALKEQIHHLLQLWKADLTATYQMEGDAFIQKFVKKTAFLPAMTKWTPELVEEVKGIAEGAEVDYPTLLVFQLLDEVWATGPEVVGERCSSLGVSRNGPRPATIAQNMDLPPYYDGFQIVLHNQDKDSDLESFVLTVPGFLGLNGVNNKSVAVCCNTLLQLSHCRDGLPVACVVRGVLQQRGARGAMAFLHKVKHASGQNYVLGGLDKVIDLECSANKISQFSPKGRPEVVWHTNHPLSNDDYDAKYRLLLEKKEASKKEENSRARLECLERRLGQDRVASLDLIKETLASQDSRTYPVSRPKGKQYAFTFAATIMVLSTEPEFHVAPGPPHLTAYEKLSFSRRR
jgi:predicted choloylglycine hydrolase